MSEQTERQRDAEGRTTKVVLVVKIHQNIQTEEEGEKEMGRETERGGRKDPRMIWQVRKCLDRQTDRQTKRGRGSYGRGRCTLSAKHPDRQTEKGGSISEVSTGFQ